MNNFFKTYYEWILGVVAFVLLAVLAGVFIWGITGLAMDFRKAIVPENAKNPQSSFDLERAKQLHLKDLVQ